VFAARRPDEVLAELNSSSAGLTDDEAEARAAEGGLNELPEAPRSVWRMIGRQFHDVLIYILIGALALSVAAPILEEGTPTLESFLDAFVIAAILVSNAILGFVQEWKAEGAIAELARLSGSTARVRRGGTERSLPSRDLVPGDVVLLDAGDRVPADARLLAAAHLRVDESSLTGESLPVPKDPKPVDEDAPVAEQRSMLFGGTLVTRGSGEAVVTATGPGSEMGRIAELVGQTVLPQTPLQAQLAKLSKAMGAAVLLLCGVVVVFGVVRDMALIDTLLVAVSLAVSAVPEGLPAVVTVCFALGVRRMADHNALTRRLDSLETLGSVTVICADKTGTITGNRMEVVATWTPCTEDAPQLAVIGASCNRAALPNLGDPTEVALLRHAASLDIERRPIDHEDVPFTSEGKYMQTRHGAATYLKGSPERILALCDSPPDGVADRAIEWAGRGLRVLAAAERSDRTRFIGLWGLEDPPRDGVRGAVEEARRAGIRTVMITGDNTRTAQAVARAVGIDADQAREGKDLDRLTPLELADCVREVSVFARVVPENKIAICQALQLQGEIVAMSGDGVNDAPALKAAHVGVAMGERGTEVAREAAAIVLTDDHFATIVRAVREGRRLHDNIRKFVLFLLRANFDELLLILTAVAFELPLPFLAVHILWINLMTDGLPALALGTEAADEDIMDRPPRPADDGLLHKEWGRLAWMATLSYAVVLGWFLWSLRGGGDIEHVRATTLTLAILIELLVAMSSRSRLPLWRVGLFGNRWLLAAMAVVFAMHLVLLYTPLSIAFQLAPLTLTDWAAVGACALLAFAGVEVIKGVSARQGT
jgi:P-type Ca2+ transporter type 2C